MLWDVDGVRVGAGGGALFVVTAGLVVTSVPTTAFVLTLGAVTGICASAVRRAGALLLGVTGWALCTDFGINQFGQLTFAPGDLARLTAYVVCAVVVGRQRFPAQ